MFKFSLRIFLLTILFFLLLPIVALAQTTQPASAPATAAWIIWLKANWYWLVTALLIPSIITGLTHYPSPTTNKIVQILKTILDVLSVTTHADSPRTFKPPFTRSRSPYGETSKNPTHLGGAPVAGLIFFIMLPCLSAATCSPKKFVSDVVNCTLPEIEKEAPELAAQAVAAAIAGNWMGELWILAQAAGPALACVELEVVAQLAPAPPTQPANLSARRMAIQAIIKAKLPTAADQQLVAKRLQRHLDSRYWAK